MIAVAAPAAVAEGRPQDPDLLPELPAGPAALQGRPAERPARGRLHRRRDGQPHPRRGLDAGVRGARQRRRDRAGAGLALQAGLTRATKRSVMPPWNRVSEGGGEPSANSISSGVIRAKKRRWRLGEQLERALVGGLRPELVVAHADRQLEGRPDRIDAGERRQLGWLSGSAACRIRLRSLAGTLSSSRCSARSLTSTSAFDSTAVARRRCGIEPERRREAGRAAVMVEEDAAVERRAHPAQAHRIHLARARGMASLRQAERLAERRAVGLQRGLREARQVGGGHDQPAGAGEHVEVPVGHAAASRRRGRRPGRPSPAPAGRGWTGSCRGARSTRSASSCG